MGGRPGELGAVGELALDVVPEPALAGLEALRDPVSKFQTWLIANGVAGRNTLDLRIAGYAQERTTVVWVAARPTGSSVSVDTSRLR